MERERPKTEAQYEREIYDEVDKESDDLDRKDSEFERRRGNVEMHRVNPMPARNRDEASYGETEIDPRREGQPSEHRAEDDEHF
jgi:hypothetical protein